MVQPLWKTVWKVFKVLDTELSFDPEILLLYILRRNENIMSTQKLVTWMFIAELFSFFLAFIYFMLK